MKNNISNSFRFNSRRNQQLVMMPFQMRLSSKLICLFIAAAMTPFPPRVMPTTIIKIIIIIYIKVRLLQKDRGFRSMMEEQQDQIYKNKITKWRETLILIRMKGIIKLIRLTSYRKKAL